MKALNDYRESDLLFVDIETAKSVEKLKPGSALYEAFEYKYRYANESKEKMLRNGSTEDITIEDFFNSKAALYGTFGKIVAIVAGEVERGDTKRKKNHLQEKKIF